MQSQFCLPPEWAPQEAVQLTWPHRHGDWLPWLTEVEPVFLAIARAVSARQGLIVCCFDEAHRQELTAKLTEAGADMARVRLFIVPSNDTWARDHGPITVFDHEHHRRLLDFRFNGWGNKYAHEQDDQVTHRLHDLGAYGEVGRELINLVLEGGSIEVDGRGSLLTTSLCLLSPERNPQLGRSQLEHMLGELLGVERVLWLEQGSLEGDDTDGHIDTLARFCDPNTIAYVSCDDPTDSHYLPLKAMAEELSHFSTLEGRPYKLVPLPLPAAIRDEKSGRRLPATYANFLIINGAVLVPTYRDPNDEIALARLAECFPEREIIPIDCYPLIFQYGSLHCITMQLPA